MRPARRLLEWIVPDTCLGCAARPAGAPGLGLCLVCRGRLRHAPPEAARCATCGRPRDGGAGMHCGRFVCGACRGDPPPFDRLLYGWAFEPPLAQVIRGLKYRRLDYLATAWAAALFDRVQSTLPPLDAVVPIPLHWFRRLGRGYNQADLLASGLARRMGLPKLALRRRRSTPAQTTQSATERRRNLRGAFTAPPSVRGLRMLLVDDIVTTGSTLRAAASALRAAGATAVTALTLARTSHPGETGHRRR